jgi:hypothetical protein
MVMDASRSLPREELVSFANDLITPLRPIYGRELTSRLRVFRALLYLDSGDVDLAERAYDFLQGIEQIDDESKKIYLSGPNSAKRVAAEIAWFLSLSGPTVLAFDQLDPFVAQNNLADLSDTSSARLKEALHVLFDFVNGVMAIRDLFARTLIVVSCLESSWKVLLKRAVASFVDRFQEPELLQLISDPGTPHELVAKRLDEGYRRAKFTPPHRTWPFAPGFFKSIPPGLTPREILNRCDKHRLDCARAGKVTELHSFSGTTVQDSPRPVDPSPLDQHFATELAAVDPEIWLDQSSESGLGDLLGEAASIFLRELPFDSNVDFAAEHDFHETKQFESLHLRLRRIFRAEDDREEHVCVRVLQKANPRAFQVRLTAALTTSGMSEKLDGRRLFLLRNSPPPAGPKGAELVKLAKECGAEFIPISAGDVRTMAAVVALANRGDSYFETWLLRNLPLSKTELFRKLVPAWIGLNTVVSREPEPVVDPKPQRPKANDIAVIQARVPPLVNPVTRPAVKETKNPPAAQAVHGSQILLGARLEAGGLGDPVYMPTVDLARHVIIRAGSGGGKTVLVKRMVEEAALCGIPSIVIDTAKDLSMLGDRWGDHGDKRPAASTKDDARLAEDYFSNVDVQIWTPGHAGGRPMRLAPLPNLSGPFAAEYDRDQAIEIAVAGLLPLAVQKKNPTVEKAILKKVVEWLTRQPPHSDNELDRLIAGLRDLPAEAFQGYVNERKLAAGMADRIQATSVADPMYGGQGEELDPAVLFGVGSSRARISILSLFAMADINTQARFIGQVASVLFNWIRRNPAPAGSPVRGLLVLDEAARFLPRNNAESKPALLLLAQQARKYGLGLILATQNPKDLDYNATANFATHIFGTANTPQVVQFIQEAMEQKGLSGLNPAQLKPGQFFCATPSLERPVRLQAPMCLSAHPHNVQLSDDDILQRAHRWLS